MFYLCALLHHSDELQHLFGLGTRCHSLLYALDFTVVNEAEVAFKCCILFSNFHYRGSDPQQVGSLSNTN